jgi:hypothetical protein
MRDEMTNFNITNALVLSLVCSDSRSAAQSPGTFTSTGEITTPRSSHRAILLTNGKSNAVSSRYSIGGLE